jgi:hypothetical protein
MINPGISAIEAGIRLTFLPYLNRKEFDRLNTDLADRHKNSRSNPRQVPNYIQGWPDLIEYDHAPDHGGVFILNSMANAFRYADLIVDTYNDQTKHPTNNGDRSILCLSDSRMRTIDRQSRFTLTSIVGWCKDQGYCLPPVMDDETLKVFQGYLSQDPGKQFDSPFNLSGLLDKFAKELLNPAPSNQYTEQYLRSYIYGLTELRGVFSNPDIDSAKLLIMPQPFETNEIHQSRQTELPGQLSGAAMPLKLFHEMANLSFKEVKFLIDPEKAVIRVRARSKEVSVGYSDLGLTHKFSKVTLNAQGKLFVSIFNGYNIIQNSALTRLTRSLKDAFNIDGSPFIDCSPAFKWRIPKDERAKQAAKRNQVEFNDNIHRTKEEEEDDPDRAGGVWLKLNDDDYNPDEFAD